MARQPRIQVAGGYYHVFARGNERRALYRDDNDRIAFLELVAAAAERFAWSLLAYCLMTNHYHLILRTSEANLAAGMHWLNAVYAQRFNRRHGRVGHLFQGRYRARLIQDGDALLGAIRYVVRNPVRARLCTDPQHWPWSSQRAVLGLSPPEFVAVEELLALFGRDRPRARTLYRDFTHTSEEEPRPSHPLIDGDAAFTAAHLAQVIPRAAYPRRMLNPTPPALDTLLGLNPTTEQLAAAHAAGHTLTAIGAHLNRHKSTISRRLAAADPPDATGKT